MKTVSVNFWLIFDRNNNGVVEGSPLPVTKDLLERVKGTQGKIVVCANDYDKPAEIEGRAPEFQEDLIKACMSERLKKSEIPFDDVVINRPRYSDFHINREVTEFKDWEKVLLKKLRGKKK